MSYRVSKNADDDLIRIFIEGEAIFGMAQAEKYNDGLYQLFSLISDNPQIARLRKELKQPIRGHPFKRHIVFYSVEDDDSVVIRRIRHSHEDWMGDMAASDS